MTRDPATHAPPAPAASARAKVAAYLHYGYLPRPPGTTAEPFPFPQRCLGGERPSPGGRERERRLDEGVWLLKGVFADAARGGGALHVVPLSGGLDSRAILAGLLGQGLGERLIAVTYGTPGTLDYEIGTRVARALGVAHERFDLTRVPVTTQGLLEAIAGGAAWTALLDSFYNRLIGKTFGRGAVYWSGFMGGELAGAHLLPGGDSPDWPAACRAFVHRQRSVKPLRLSPPGYDPEAVLPGGPYVEPEALSYDEQLDFAVRQRSFVRPLVMAPGYRYGTPFLDERWVRFILGLAREHRADQALYVDILRRAYPAAFALPTKRDNGLTLDAAGWRRRWRWYGHRARIRARMALPYLPWPTPPRTNYVDLDRALRRRPDLRDVVRANLTDLARRGAVDWLDVDELWRRHERGRANISQALMLLAALEINLKAEDGASGCGTSSAAPTMRTAAGGTLGSDGSP